MKHFILAPIFSMCASMAMSEEVLENIITDDIIAEIIGAGLIVGSRSQFVNAMPCVGADLLYNARFKESGDELYNRDWRNVSDVMDSYIDETVIVLGYNDEGPVRAVVKVGGFIFSYEKTPGAFNLSIKQFNDISPLSGHYQLSTSFSDFYRLATDRYSMGDVVLRQNNTDLCL